MDENSKTVLAEIFEFLNKDVRRLVNSHDFLGTGTDTQGAKKEEFQWQCALDAMIEKVAYLQEK